VGDNNLNTSIKWALPTGSISSSGRLLAMTSLSGTETFDYIERVEEDEAAVLRPPPALRVD
jgi:hypothetical protein